MAITDDAIISKLKDVLDQGKNSIVACTVSGQPLTQADYIKKVLEAKKEVKEGDFIARRKC